MTRQKTRYQPSLTRFNGTSSSSGLVADRAGVPFVSCFPAASVTETIANRGSTASEYVSATCVGALSRIALADGSVFSSAACANAEAGSRSAASRARRSARLIRRAT
jgi:hypothetical protein